LRHSKRSLLGVSFHISSPKRLSPKASRLSGFKKRAGMIWSVSTFSIGSGTALLGKDCKFIVCHIIYFTAKTQRRNAILICFTFCHGASGLFKKLLLLVFVYKSSKPLLLMEH
jgi:hypothetical protein